MENDIHNTMHSIEVGFGSQSCYLFFKHVRLDKVHERNLNKIFLSVSVVQNKNVGT